MRAAAPLAPFQREQFLQTRRGAAGLRTTDMGDKSYGRLLALHRGATKTMVSLATKLRITPQSNRASSRDGRDPTAGRPPLWEL
jgi:hypothetical protein